VAEILARGMGVVIQVLALGGFGGQVASAFAAGKLAADVELVGLFDVQARAHGLFDWEKVSGAGELCKAPKGWEVSGAASWRCSYLIVDAGLCGVIWIRNKRPPHPNPLLL